LEAKTGLAKKNEVALQSVAVICLPTSTMNTAGVTSPIRGTNTEGSQVAANSLVMAYANKSLVTV